MIKNTISKACSDPDYEPGTRTMKNILKAVRKIDCDMNADDFWGL